MRLSKRETALLILLGVVVILVLGANFLIMPLSRDVQEAQAMLLEKSDEVTTTRTDVELAGVMAQGLKNAYARTEALKKPYENSLKQEEVDLWINNLLAKNGLEVQNLDISNIQIATANFESAQINALETLPIQAAADVLNGTAVPAAPTEETGEAEPAAEATTQPTDAGALYQINAIINCRGSFDSIIAFANDLYASGRALRITTLEMQQAGEDGIMPGVVIVEFYGIPAVGDAAQTGTGDAK